MCGFNSLYFLIRSSDDVCSSKCLGFPSTGKTKGICSFSARYSAFSRSVSGPKKLYGLGFFLSVSTLRKIHFG